MGWTFGWRSKDELLKHIRQQYGDRYLVGRVVGSVYWFVATTPHEPGRFIACYLLSGRGGDWGYKDIDESMGPCELSCPLAYLDIVPQPPSEYAGPWRERVRAHHAKRKERERATRAAEPGDTIFLKAGCTIATVTVTERRGSVLVGKAPDGHIFQVPPRLIDSVQASSAPLPADASSSEPSP